MLMDLRETGMTGKELEHRLDEVYITANKNAIPNEPGKSRLSPRGMRIGTPAVTTRGFGAPEMLRIAESVAGRNRFRQQGKRYPPKCTRYLRKFSNLLASIFADSRPLESAFLLALFGLHNAK